MDDIIFEVKQIYLSKKMFHWNKEGVEGVVGGGYRVSKIDELERVGHEKIFPDFEFRNM